MRIGTRTLLPLGLCAATAAAAAAHVLIDIVGDYALPHDTYDNLAHTSRELFSGVAFLIAFALAARGLRFCCELATLYRSRLPRAASCLRERIGFIAGVVAGSAVLVPAMELLDGRLGGMPVKELDDAFGGSILLGLSVTALCAGAVAALVFALACWLISHRDDIAAIIETLLRHDTSLKRPSGRELQRYSFTPRRRRASLALRLSKRGPPYGSSRTCLYFHTTKGDLREFLVRARSASVRCARDRAVLRGAGFRGTTGDCASR
jgi:hypothetical protein